MRKLLFSRSQKNHFSDTVVRVGKNNLGFSLVELIIVIAIMAVLVAIAIPVLGVFIEKAKKSNDMKVITDVIHAIEIGNKSGAYVDDKSFAIGELAFPIGFVVLSADGMKIITSTTEIVSPIEGACKFVEGDITIIEPISRQTFSCSKGNSHTKAFDCNSVATVHVTYCEAHSQVSIASSDETYISSYECADTTDGCDHNKDNWNPVETTVLAGTLVAAGSNKVYGKQSETVCQAAYAYQNGSFSSPNVGHASAGDPLYDAIVAVFGDSLDDVKLTYDGWQTESGLDHATIFADCDDVFATIRGLSETLLEIKELASNPIISVGAALAGVDLNALIGQYLSEDYQNGDDMLDAYSDHVHNMYPSNDNGEWDAVWLGAANSVIEYDFGMPDGVKPRNDFAYGTIIAYNKAFASYCAANGVPNAYADIIKDFGTGIGGGGTLYDTINGVMGDVIPRTVNYAAFNGATHGGSKTLEQRFVDAGDSDKQWFNRCRELYTVYATSDACVENGRAVYDMLITVYETKEVAKTYGEINGGDMFAYYDSYLQEISALYNAAEQSAGDGIIIIVTMKDGLLEYQISPAAADPRNK